MDHLFQCQSEQATMHRDVELNKLQKFLRQKNTAPNIKDMIFKSITAWCNLTSFFPNGLLPSWEAAVEQQKIGWRQFLLGKVSSKWMVLQQHYLH